MADIFVSYKTEDRPRAAHLVAALRDAGLDVWWDQDIPAGGGWRETIAGELDEAALCVVAWSEASTGPGGRFVREEAERCAGRNAYLGVRIDPVTPPFGFAEWQAIDLSQWTGKRSDPLLAQFVDQVRARLADAPTTAVRPTAPVRRRRRGWAFPAAAAALIVVAALAALLMLRGGEPAQSPTAFVNARLDATACSWLQIASVAPAEGGERISLTGIAAAPDAVQGAILSEAMEASVPVAEVAVDDVAAGPNETCAELDLLRRHRLHGRPRLQVIQPRGAFEQTEFGRSMRFEFEIDFKDLPPHALLLGLDSLGGIQVATEPGDLRAYRGRHRPIRADGERVTYEGRFFDENQGARNVGLVLMTSTRPIDPAFVEAIGRRADRDFLARFARDAAAGNWRFELALIPCGFEGSITRRQC